MIFPLRSGSHRAPTPRAALETGEAIHAQATVGYKYGTSTVWNHYRNGTFLDDARAGLG